MKQQIKYCVFGVLLLLLNVMAMRAQIPTLNVCQKSGVSYVAAQDNTIRLIHYIHKTQSCEESSQDNQLHDMKYGIRIFRQSNDCRDNVQSHTMSCQTVHPYLHTDTIQYYIYTLEKIIT